MSNPYIDAPIIEAYVYETENMIESLEQLLMSSEKEGEFTTDSINEIFRFMHTIKGSSAMMSYTEISTLAHRIEDVFYVIRENRETVYDFSRLVDIVLESVDFFKVELMKVKSGETLDGDSRELTCRVESILLDIKEENSTDKESEKPKEKKADKQPEKQLDNQPDKQVAEQSGKEEKEEKETAQAAGGRCYKAVIRFKQDSEMENIRAYTVVHNMEEMVDEEFYSPDGILEDDSAIPEIREKGFLIVFRSQEDFQKIEEYLENTIYLDKLEVTEVDPDTYQKLADECRHCPQEEIKDVDIAEPEAESCIMESVEPGKEIVATAAKEEIPVKHEKVENSANSACQGIISVNVDKLDKLMDMVGELVIAEAMVSQNPEVTRLEIESFEKASRQLHKISTELQDMVMAIRMVPLSTTFMKMHRIVRDMNKKLNKDVVLEVYGEETEVDKNIIEKISDPLMHIIRNSLDHGIEDENERIQNGKDRRGTVSLEAKNSGSDVLIIIRDDGKGLDKEKIYQKAVEHGLTAKTREDMSDREIYRMILYPGFSTKEEVTEFSGRGVGMDVVAKNIEGIGGTVLVDSEIGRGTTTILKIPLTLAIIEGMNIRVGDARFTLPIVSIKQSFRPKASEIIKDTEGQEMIMVRGNCYPIIRLHELFEVKSGLKNMEEGILIMVEEDEKSYCLFADELLGQQQIVVKSLPGYIKGLHRIRGIGGCTLLGDGSISLILDVGALELSGVADNCE